MVESLPRQDSIDIACFDAYLLSDNSMGLADFDGFLTGLVAGPELVMPSEWLVEQTCMV